jgi:hypothetical protein
MYGNNGDDINDGYSGSAKGEPLEREILQEDKIV